MNQIIPINKITIKISDSRQVAIITSPNDETHIEITTLKNASSTKDNETDSNKKSIFDDSLSTKITADEFLKSQMFKELSTLKLEENIDREKPVTANGFLKSEMPKEMVEIMKNLIPQMADNLNIRKSGVHNTLEQLPYLKGERECKRVLEKIYGDVFISARPDWLVDHETGKFLTLGLYNEKLKIACNYEGKHNRQYIYQNFIKLWGNIMIKYAGIKLEEYCAIIIMYI